jgi:hypothetical protein
LDLLNNSARALVSCNFPALLTVSLLSEVFQTLNFHHYELALLVLFKFFFKMLIFLNLQFTDGCDLCERYHSVHLFNVVFTLINLLLCPGQKGVLFISVVSSCAGGAGLACPHSIERNHTVFPLL